MIKSIRQFVLLTGMACALVAPPSLANQASIESPQQYMVSPQILSLGGAASTLTDELGGIFINPASIADIDSLQLSASHQQVIGEFDYRSFAIALPYDEYKISLSYGSDMLHGIPRTQLYNGVIYQTDTYSSGFNIAHLGVAQSIYVNDFYLSKLSYGFGFKAFEQALDGDTRVSYGMDVGLVGVLDFEYEFMQWLDKASVGLGIVNFYASDFPEWLEGSSAASVERQMYLSTQLSMFRNWNLFFTGYYSSIQLNEFALGTEYQWSKTLSLRGSMINPFYDGASPYYTMGVGMTLPNVAFLNFSQYEMRLDYNLTLHQDELAGLMTHAFGISVLGESRDPRPKILKPTKDGYINERTVSLSGVGLRNSGLYLYVNHQEMTQVQIDRYGKWKIPNIPLAEGKNFIYVKSKDKSVSNYSHRSNTLNFIVDTLPPEYDMQMVVKDDGVGASLKLVTKEPLRAVDAMMDNTQLRFSKINDTEYQADFNIPAFIQSGKFLPQRMPTISVRVEDIYGNRSRVQQLSFFGLFTFPRDKAIVFSDRVTAMGRVGPAVEEVRINDRPVIIGPSRAILHPLFLTRGKNTIKVDLRLSDGPVLSYYARVLSIKRFADVPRNMKGRRDIEFLATLGYLDPKLDGLFHPNDTLSRLDMTKFLVKQKKAPVEQLSYDPFLDVPVTHPAAPEIQAAVNSGLMVAYPDGTFKPDLPVTKADAFSILNNNNIIDSDELVLDDSPITRAEFAEMLKQVRRYDRRVKLLLDWDQGYNLPD